MNWLLSSPSGKIKELFQNELKSFRMAISKVSKF